LPWTIYERDKLWLVGCLGSEPRLALSKRNLLYIRNKSVPRCKHFQTKVIKTKQLMLYTAKVAVCSEIRKKHSTQSEHHVGMLNVKPGGT